MANPTLADYSLAAVLAAHSARRSSAPSITLGQTTPLLNDPVANAFARNLTNVPTIPATAGPLTDPALQGDVQRVQADQGILGLAKQGMETAAPFLSVVGKVLGITGSVGRGAAQGALNERADLAKSIFGGDPLGFLRTDTNNDGNYTNDSNELTNALRGITNDNAGFGQMRGLKYRQNDGDPRIVHSLKLLGAIVGDTASDPLTYVGGPSTLGKAAAKEATAKVVEIGVRDALAAGAKEGIEAGTEAAVKAGAKRAEAMLSKSSLFRDMVRNELQVATVSEDDITRYLAKVASEHGDQAIIDLAARDAGVGAASALQRGGHHELASFLDGVTKETGSATNLFDQLPSELRGAWRLRNPINDQTLIELSKGGGRTAEKLPGGEALIKAGEKWAGLRNEVGASPLTKPFGHLLGGRDAALKVNTRTAALAGQEASLRAEGALLAQRAARAETAATNGAVRAGAVDAIDKMNRTIKEADNSEAMQEAITREYNNMDAYLQGTLTPPTEGLDAKAYEVAAGLKASMNEPYKASSAKLGTDFSTADVYDGTRRVLTDEAIKMEQAKNGIGRSIPEQAAVHSRSGAFAWRVGENKDAFPPDVAAWVAAHPEAQPGDFVRFMSPREANVAFAKENQGALPEGFKLFEEDPTKIAQKVVPDIERRNEHAILRKTLKDYGIALDPKEQGNLDPASLNDKISKLTDQYQSGADKASEDIAKAQAAADNVHIQKGLNDAEAKLARVNAANTAARQTKNAERELAKATERHGKVLAAVETVRTKVTDAVHNIEGSFAARKNTLEMKLGKDLADAEAAHNTAVAEARKVAEEKVRTRMAPEFTRNEEASLRRITRAENVVKDWQARLERAQVFDATRKNGSTVESVRRVSVAQRNLEKAQGRLSVLQGAHQDLLAAHEASVASRVEAAMVGTNDAMFAKLEKTKAGIERAFKAEMRTAEGARKRALDEAYREFHAAQPGLQRELRFAQRDVSAASRNAQTVLEGNVARRQAITDRTAKRAAELDARAAKVQERAATATENKKMFDQMVIEMHSVMGLDTGAATKRDVLTERLLQTRELTERNVQRLEEALGPEAEWTKRARKTVEDWQKAQLKDNPLLTALGGPTGTGGEGYVQLGSLTDASTRRFEVTDDVRNLWVHPEIAQAMTRMYRATKAGNFNKVLELVWKPFNTAWKFAATVGSGPKFTLRNLGGGTYNTWAIGATGRDYSLAAKYTSEYRAAVKDAMEQFTKGAYEPGEASKILDTMLERRLSKVKVGTSNLWDIHQQMETAQIFGGTITSAAIDANEIDNIIATLLDNGRRKFIPSAPPGAYEGYRKFLGAVLDNRAARWMGDVNQAAERYLRAAGYLSGLRRYGYDEVGHVMARVRTIAANFDYGDTSPLEQKFMKDFGLAPFFAWTKNNVPYQMRLLMNEPGKINMILKANEAVHQATGRDANAAMLDPYMPQWVQEANGYAAFVPGVKDPIAVGLNLPLLDLNRFMPSPAALKDPKTFLTTAASGVQDDAVGTLSPAPKFLLEALTGVNTFTGAKYTDTEATNLYKGLSLLPGIPDTYVDPQTGKTVASGFAQAQLNNFLPFLGTAVRTVPGLGNDSYDARRPVQIFQQLGGAALPITAVGTLTPSQIRGELRTRAAAMENEIKKFAGNNGLDPAGLREMVAKGVPADMTTQEFVQAARDQGYVAPYLQPPKPKADAVKLASYGGKKKSKGKGKKKSSGLKVPKPKVAKKSQGKPVRIVVPSTKRK